MAKPSSLFMPLGNWFATSRHPVARITAHSTVLDRVLISVYLFSIIAISTLWVASYRHLFRHPILDLNNRYSIGLYYGTFQWSVQTIDRIIGVDATGAPITETNIGAFYRQTNATIVMPRVQLGLGFGIQKATVSIVPDSLPFAIRHPFSLKPDYSSRPQMFKNGITEYLYGIACWIPLTLFLILLAIQLILADKHARSSLRIEGICLKCGYDLRATPTRCPECGTVPLSPAATNPVTT